MSEYIKSVGIIGLGYVGLTLAVALASRGVKVYGAEKNEQLKEQLRQGKPHFFERGLDLMLKRELANNTFRIVDKIPDYCDIYVPCVSTPFDKIRNEPDLTVFRGAANELKESLSKGSLVINRSTVPVGATRKIMLPILEETGMKCGIDFGLAYAPERTLEGKAMEELFSNSQIIGGHDEMSAVRAAGLFRIITPTIVNVSSLETAEIIKLLDNSYRDVTFGFANEFATVCEDLGLDAIEVIKSANIHYPRNRIPVPSPGVGGTCLTKDGRILMHSSPNKEMAFIPAARKINEYIPARMVDRIFKKMDELGMDTQNARFFLCGFAFKGDPETDDLRDSTCLWFLDELKKRTSNIVGFDPVVENYKIEEKGVRMVDDLKEGFHEADVVVVLNNHKMYNSLDLSEYAKKMKSPGIIFDSWRKFELPHDLAKRGIHHMSIGK
jgi:UDP-N-acetyl-D-mannosaminuronic acid dehydrogenase